MQNATNRWGAIGLGIALGFGAVTPSQAQQTYTREFSVAAVLLTTGDTIRGPLRLHTNQSILELRNDKGTVTVVPAAKVQLFAGSQEVLYEKKKYATLIPVGADANLLALTTRPPATSSATPDVVTIFRTCFIRLKENGLPTPVLCEQLTNGPVMLLCRREIYNRLHTTYYLGRPQGIEPVAAERLRKPWKQVLEYFPEYAAQLKAFISKNELISSNDQHVALLVAYGNSLLAENAK